MSTKRQIGKDDLKRLMKEKKEALEAAKRIVHPLAKYSTTGKLSCVVCGVSINTSALWAPHLLSNSHKQKYAALKAQQDAIKRKEIEGALKRKAEAAAVSNPPASSEDGASKPKKPALKGLVTDYYADEDGSSDSENENIKETNIADPTDVSEPPKEKIVDQVPLPEGFFDDPQLDAKARNVEYKDPLEEEMEKFQKAIKEANIEAEQLITEELEERDVDRDIEQIDEQIHNWERVNYLEKRKELLELERQKSEPMEMDTDDPGGDEDPAEEGFYEFLDWRAKATWSS